MKMQQQRWKMKKKPIQHKNIKNSTRHKDKAVGSGNEMKIIGNIWKINFFCAFWCTWMRIASMHRLKYYNTVYRISLNCGIHWAHAQFYSTHTRYEVWWIIWWFVQVSPFMVFSDSLRLNTLREFVKPRISTSLFLWTEREKKSDYFPCILHCLLALYAQVVT